MKTMIHKVSTLESLIKCFVFQSAATFVRHKTYIFGQNKQYSGKLNVIK